MKRRNLLYSLILFLGLVSLACQTLMPPSAPRPASTLVSEVPGTPSTPDEVKARQLRVFKYVWMTVQRNYLYADYNGTDWDAIKDEFEPRVEAALDDEAFWWLMQEMIWRLNDQHSAYLTPEQAAEEDQSMTGDLDYVGIGVFAGVPEEGDYGVILFTLPNSPAEDAGLRAHDRLLTIDGVPACCTPEGFDNLDLLGGPAGTSVELELQHPGEAARTVTVTRARIQTQLPLEQRRIATEGGDVGYLMIPTLWDETIAERTRDAYRELTRGEPLVGLIIDMRVNGGGAYTQLHDLLSLFTEGEIGGFRHRNTETELLSVKADPIGESQTIPLVILIGRDTVSYAEVFSGVLQDVGRATLIGQPTAGNVETVYPYDLEDGSRLWLAEEAFEPPSGARWEGMGVQPDIVIDGNWEDFTAERDAQIDAAVEWLSNQ